MPKARPVQREGETYKGYSRSSKLGHYIDPKGRQFHFGWKQSDGSMSICSGRSPSKNMPEALFLEIVEFFKQIDDKKKAAEKKAAKIKAQETLYSPGGLGYLFLKQSTKVGKKL